MSKKKSKKQFIKFPSMTVHFPKDLEQVGDSGNHVIVCDARIKIGSRRISLAFLDANEPSVFVLLGVKGNNPWSGTPQVLCYTKKELEKARRYRHMSLLAEAATKLGVNNTESEPVRLAVNKALGLPDVSQIEAQNLHLGMKAFKELELDLLQMIQSQKEALEDQEKQHINGTKN